MTYQRRLTNVEIRLSNDEIVKGDIIEDEGAYVVLKNTKETIRIQRGAIVYITEEA